MDWERTLAGLLAGEHTPTEEALDAGAELRVTDDGEEVFRAALARHYRPDEHDPRLLWVRPVSGPRTDPATKAIVFPLNTCRRRALAWSSVQVHGDRVEFALRSGQQACIRPAEGSCLDQLHLWDDFSLTILTAAEEHDLARLDADSWHGRFS